MEQETTDQHVRNDERDATGEFFAVGTPLHALRAGYIRRRADDMLYEAAVAGRYAHIIAPDRSGKSSLIAATAARLENNGVHVAVLDLAQIGVRDMAQDAGRWFYNVAYRLLRQLRIRFDLQAWWHDKAVLSNRQRLVEFYSEVILQNIQQNIVVFVDAIQCIADVPFGDQLLASIRSAHNSRTTDPDFTRLTFVLIGECDPLSLVNEPEMSPFNATQPVPLDDFTRDDLNLFVTELNLDNAAAQQALDRIYYWTRGQPYLSQKLARAVAREDISDDVDAQVDRIVMQQLAGRAALHSEPHMSHIHREIVSSGKHVEGMLNLYGRLAKGIHVPTDLGSELQRRLIAVGLIEIDESGELRIRNRIYEAVFTARWANDNLPTNWRVPVAAVAAALLLAIIPLWYTQWLPRSYVSVLTLPTTELAAAESTWLNLRSFPGHAGTADGVYRSFLNQRAAAATTVEEIETIAAMASELGDAGTLPQSLLADFWDRRTQQAMRDERRDAALMASLDALVLSTPRRRNRSAMLVGADYPLLLASSPPEPDKSYVFNPGSLLLTAADGARIAQWSLAPDGLSKSEDWLMTALEVTPLVRRVVVDSSDRVRRVALRLNVSHPRMRDLRIKVIAPSGRTIEIDVGVERASSIDDLRIDSRQLAPLVGESMAGTWSISLRDEAIGVAGHLVGWQLTLNSQALVEDFERGLGIPDPVERETERFWFSADGRYAVARATQSDSARLWDLAFAKPVAAIAVSESERFIGLDDSARQLITSTVDSVHVWDTATGRRAATLPVGPASGTATLTADGRHLFVQQLSDIETRFELWDLATLEKSAELVIAGAPAHVAVDAAGSRIAIADYDRAVRVWDFAKASMLTQIDLPLQPSRIEMNAAGELLAAVFGEAGLAVWNLGRPQQPLLERFGEGTWQLMFSPSGTRFAAGRPRSGYRLYEAPDGRLVGPAIGADGRRVQGRLLGFSKDEDVVVTRGPEGRIRFWQLPVTTIAADIGEAGHAVWPPSGDAVVAALPDGSALAVGDRSGHVHLLPRQGGGVVATTPEEISFLGHTDAVRKLAVSRDGAYIASVGADNSLRVWASDSGQPLPFITNVSGGSVEQLAFSPDGRRLALLAGNRAVLVDAAAGDVVAELELGERHGAIAFGSDDALYLGSAAGSLHMIDRDSAGVWNLRRVWSGDAAIRRLEASPRGRYLVVVDRNDRASLLSMAGNQPGELSIQLPSPIEDVVFSPGGSRVLLRSARWVHRVGASSNGLIWLDAMFVPQALGGARIVFPADDRSRGGVGRAFHLPVAQDGVAHVPVFRFGDTEGPGLFGNKDELIATWWQRLAIGGVVAPD